MCAGADQYKPWCAILIGAIAGASFFAWHHLMLRLRVDDPLDAVAGKYHLCFVHW